MSNIERLAVYNCPSSGKRNSGGPWSKNEKPVVIARNAEHARELRARYGRRAVVKVRF